MTGAERSRVQLVEEERRGAEKRSRGAEEQRLRESGGRSLSGLPSQSAACLTFPGTKGKGKR